MLLQQRERIIVKVKAKALQLVQIIFYRQKCFSSLKRKEFTKPQGVCL